MNDTTKSKQQRVVYFALVSGLSHGCGVEKKIRGTLKAAERLGYQVRLVMVPGGSIKAHFRLARSIGSASEQILFVRGTSYGSLISMWPMLLARLRAKIVVLDVPTPLRVSIHEIIRSEKKFVLKVLKLSALIIAGPWSSWPASRIIQYASEGAWFSIGNTSKTLLMGNGVDLDSVPVRRIAPPWPARYLNIIGVAGVSFWHGYDRVICAIHSYLNKYPEGIDVHFYVVGDGDALPALKRLAKELDVEQRIHFTGRLDGKDLMIRYEAAHIAVGSLGLHRKKLLGAAGLKEREYCAIGIPFISSGSDPDFDKEEDFRFVVSTTDDCQDVSDLIESISRKDKLADIGSIRRFATERLSIDKKFSDALRGIRGIE